MRKGRKYGYKNAKGEQVVECKFDITDDFSEGLVRVGKYCELTYEYESATVGRIDYWKYKYSCAWGYMNAKRK